jgi:hypothetical protein
MEGGHMANVTKLPVAPTPEHRARRDRDMAVREHYQRNRRGRSMPPFIAKEVDTHERDNDDPQ